MVRPIAILLLLTGAAARFAYSSTNPGEGFIAACIAAIPSGAIADPVSGTNTGVQVTPDRSHVLVSKDVGTERWAIAGSSVDDSISGNVFRTDGGAPAFVWCRKTDDDFNSDIHQRKLTYECSGADPCPSAGCNPDTQWNVIASNVQLLASFFLP